MRRERNIRSDKRGHIYTLCFLELLWCYNFIKKKKIYYTFSSSFSFLLLLKWQLTQFVFLSSKCKPFDICTRYLRVHTYTQTHTDILHTATHFLRLYLFCSFQSKLYGLRRLPPKEITIIYTFCSICRVASIVPTYTHYVRSLVLWKL